MSNPKTNSIDLAEVIEFVLYVQNKEVQTFLSLS